MLTTMIRYALVLLAAVMPAFCAMASGESGPAGQSPKPESYSPNWFGLMYTFAFLACIALVGFKNARRTHLD